MADVIKHNRPGDGYSRGCRCQECTDEHAFRARLYRHRGTSRGVRGNVVIYRNGLPVYTPEHWGLLLAPRDVGGRRQTAVSDPSPRLG